MLIEKHKNELLTLLISMMNENKIVEEYCDY